MEIAANIARSASGTEIDWEREPLNQREAKIRKRWLERQLADPLRRLVLKFKTDTLGHKVASDLAAALKEMEALDALEALERDQRLRDEYSDVADELDGRVMDNEEADDQDDD